MANSNSEFSFEHEEDFDLSDTERKIIAQIGHGYSNKEIAQKLGFSEGTIRNYLSVILDKLDLRDRTQLAIWYLSREINNGEKKIKNFLIAVLVCCLTATFYYTQKPIVLTIGVFAVSNWNVPSPYSGKIIDDVIERFEKTHPNVQVEYVSGILKEDYSDWVSKEALNGKLPDVFMVLSDDLSTYAKVGMLEPLDTFMQTDADFNKNRYFSTTLNAGNIYDHQYALPYESSPTLMFVNKTLLEENGVAIPNVNWTWDDFYSICEKLTVDTDGDGEIDQFGEYGYTWQNALSSNGQALYDEESMKCTLQKQDVYSAIEFVRQLNRSNRNQNVTSELFDKGRLPFVQ